MAKSLGNSALAVGYLRLSPRDRDDPRLGFDAQKAAIRAWCAREKVRLLCFVRDVDVSGDTPGLERRGLRLALREIRERGAGVLVVAKRDRLARDVVEAGLIGREARRAGATVRSADGIGGDSPEERLMATVTDAVAAWELDKIRQRTREALAVKRARGECVGKPPYGTRVALDGRTLEPEPREVRVIARASELRAEGYSYRAIARVLAAEGLRSRKGSPFFHTQVAKMVTLAARTAVPARD